MQKTYRKTYQITTNMLDCHDCLKMSTLLDVAQEVAGDHAEELGCGFETMIKPRFVEFNRETEFYHNGELFAVSRSTWMVINIKDFSVKAPDFFKGFDDDLGYFKRRIRKLPVIEKSQLQKVKETDVLYSMLDHNGHMNNTKYVDFYLDIFRPEFSVKTLQIEYIKQSFLDDKLSLYIKDNEGKRYLSGYKDDELKFYMECEEFKE